MKSHPALDELPITAAHPAAFYSSYTTHRNDAYNCLVYAHKTSHFLFSVRVQQRKRLHPEN